MPRAVVVAVDLGNEAHVRDLFRAAATAMREAGTSDAYHDYHALQSNLRDLLKHMEARKGPA